MSTYSDNLKLELITNGTQTGTWGTTTNKNLGILIEEAIAGVKNITISTANYVLSNLNGITDEARQAVLVINGTPGDVRTILVPSGQTKTYIIKNSTTGGFSINVQTQLGSGLTGTGAIATIQSGASIQVYCTGSDCYAVAPYSATTATPITFQGYALGTVLTVTSAPSAPIVPNASNGPTVYNSGIFYTTSGFPSNTTIVNQLSGTTGGVGTYTISNSATVGAAAFPQPITALTTLNQIATVDYVQTRTQSMYLAGVPTADTATAAAFEAAIFGDKLIINKFYITGNPISLGQYLNGGTLSDGSFVSAYGTGTAGSATYTGYISGTTLTITAGSVVGTVTTNQYLVGTGIAVGTKIVAGSGLSWTVSISQTAGSATNLVSIQSLGPITTASDQPGWLTIQNDAQPLTDSIRSPMLSFLSPLQLTNTLFVTNIAYLLGTLGTQSDDAVNIKGGAISNVAITDSSLTNVTIGSTSTATTQTAGDNSTKVATTAYADSAVAVGIPSGAVMTFAMNTAPTGWLAANGATVSRTTYASLFSAIGTTFGVGDGSTTFKLPDLRGYFARGMDNGRGVDTGRVFGSNQDATGISNQVGQAVTVYFDNPDSALYNPFVLNSSGGQGGTNRTISYFKVRPYNVALLYCIKI